MTVIIELQAQDEGAGNTSTSQMVSATTTNGIMRRNSTHKSANGKSLQSSLKTTRSSVTGFHSRTFQIHTCCGILELNCLRVTSFAALMISLLAFAALIVIIAINFALHTNVESLETTGTFYRQLMKLSCRAAVTSQYNRTISLEYTQLYNEYYTKFYEVMNNVIANVPADVLYWNRHNMTRQQLKSRRAIVMEVAMISNITSGNYSNALTDLDSKYYQYLLTGYEEEGQPILDYVDNVEHQNEERDMVTTTIGLAIVCCSIVVVIPVLIVYVCLSSKKDNSKEKQLRQVKKYMVMDTINDVVLSEKFKEYCKQERSEENFTLLEKINEYKKLSEKSFDIQVFLFDTDVLSSSDQPSECTSPTNSEDTKKSLSTSTSSEDSSKKKNKNKKGFSEKDLQDIEKKKYEIAFEIYSEFLDVRGDHSVNINKQIADSETTFGFLCQG